MCGCLNRATESLSINQQQTAPRKSWPVLSVHNSSSVPTAFSSAAAAANGVLLQNSTHWSPALRLTHTLCLYWLQWSFEVCVCVCDGKCQDITYSFSASEPVDWSSSWLRVQLLLLLPVCLLKVFVTETESLFVASATFSAIHHDHH